MSILLAEPPFYSIQGEGYNSGQPCLFIRFAGCNFLKGNIGWKEGYIPCPWCDTKYALSNKEGDLSVNMTAQEIADYISNIEPMRIVFTGGEPMLYQKEMRDILSRVSDATWNRRIDRRLPVTIETNGSIEPISSKNIDDNFRLTTYTFVISPKFQNNYKVQVTDSTLGGSIYKQSSMNTNIKFVYEGEKSEKDIIKFVYENNYKPNYVYVMPECTDREKHLANQIQVVEFCKKYGFNFSPRLQILIYGKKIGV
jgi:7-carboxy-7-deazaguanine synthase